MPASHDLATRLKAEAQSLGFALAGICPAVEPPGLSRFHDWLAAGYAGQMRYLEDRREAYAHPRHVLDGARSVLMLAWPYRTVEPHTARPGEGRVSRYAWGLDYHDLIHARLKELAAWLAAASPMARVRGVVDSAPLLEREFAQLAGLGWIGKNTLLLNREWGSWLFLAALVTDLELPADEPFGAEHCGTCRACLDACPSGAFVAPYVLDARRCLSYLTIELREEIPTELRGELGDWLFGCDVCQEVCPWNWRAPAVGDAGLHPRAEGNPAPLAQLFEWDDAEFRRRFRHTPLWRARRRGLLRNAAIVLGNQGDPNSLACLEKGLADPEPLVRGAAAWALGRLSATARPSSPVALRAGAALRVRRNVESDPQVLEEIRAALEGA